MAHVRNVVHAICLWHTRVAGIISANEVSRSRNRPTGPDVCDRGPTHDRVAVHQRNRDLAGNAAPEDVGFAIAVEVPGSRDRLDYGQSKLHTPGERATKETRVEIVSLTGAAIISRLTCRPTSARSREHAVAFFEASLQEHPCLAIAVHRLYPEV